MIDDLVPNFDLPIGLRPCDRREDLLELEIVAEFLEFVTIELCSIVRYNGVGDSILVGDVFVEELLNLCWCDGCKRFCFNPINEVVDKPLLCTAHYLFL